MTAHKRRELETEIACFPPKQEDDRPRVRGGPKHASPEAEACAEGLGFGLFLSYQVDALIRAGKLCRVLEDWEPPPLPVSVVYTDSRLMPSRLRLLVDLLTQEMRERPDLAT